MVHLTTALDASSGVPLYEQLYRSLAGEMRSGTLAAGTRMPGKRRLAAELSVSVNTVDAAYQMLAAEGYLESRERSGFYVQEYLALPSRPAGGTEQPAPPKPEPPVLPVRYDLSTRGVDPELFPFRTWARLQKEESAVQQVLDSPAAAKGLDDSYQPVPDVRDDPAYFARLYDQYATDVLRVCYFYLSDREKAEDVCQDVFVRLMTTHPLLQPGREKSWLLKVALNRCRDLWRGAWLKRVILGGPTFELIPAPDEFSRRDDQQAMMAAINQLPATFKEVILLHYYQGMNIAEIAQMLELPEGTISSRLSRGRKKLESILLKGGDAR